jgi:hypothetical protein
MAPEQKLGTTPDPLSDQFAFATMAYEALFGGLPSEGKQPPKDAAATAIARVLGRGFAPSAESRYPSLQELLADLERTRRPAPRWWIAAAVGAALLAGGIAYASISTPPRRSSEETDAPERAPRARSTASASVETPASDALPLDVASRRAGEHLVKQEFDRCLDALRGQTNAHLLQLKVECARGVSLDALATTCAEYRRHVGEDLDGCSAQDVEAARLLAAGSFERCVRTLADLPWGARRGVMLAECANRWNAVEGRVLQCRFLRKKFPANPGDPPCEAVLETSKLTP